MNVDTGELYQNYNEAYEKLIKEFSESEVKRKLKHITIDEYVELKGMNRAARRRWAREQQKKRKRTTA